MEQSVDQPLEGSEFPTSDPTHREQISCLGTSESRNIRKFLPSWKKGTPTEIHFSQSLWPTCKCNTKTYTWSEGRNHLGWTYSHLIPVKLQLQQILQEIVSTEKERQKQLFKSIFTHPDSS